MSDLDRPERLYSLRQLTEMGYGSRDTLHKRIAEGVLPAVRVGNAWKVRERHLVFLAEPVDDHCTDADDVAYRNALADRLVSAWSRLPDERKGEIGRLLAVA